MTDDTCTFSFISAKDSAPKTATGIERSWLDLKLEFHRQGEGLPGARYYKTTSEQGPQLFAVKQDQTVWYHDENKWHLYRTATDVKYAKIHSVEFNPQRKNSTSKKDDDDDDDSESFIGEQDELGSQNINVTT